MCYHMTMRWSPVAVLLAVLTSGPLFLGAARAAETVPFPDVPPWHWAYNGIEKDRAAGLFEGYPAGPIELAANAVTQVYDGFVHSGAAGAQTWVERFTFNRPPTWPEPLQRSQILRFSLTGMRVRAGGDTAVVTFTATVTTRRAQTVTTPMRAALRYDGQNWQVDFASLASGSSLFR